ncbi:MAG: hypothetical protein PVG49_08870 [Desulfobacteraceae bacterium]|jgi:hypothetical protein
MTAEEICEAIEKIECLTFTILDKALAWLAPPTKIGGASGLKSP